MQDLRICISSFAAHISTRHSVQTLGVTSNMRNPAYTSCTALKGEAARWNPAIADLIIYTSLFLTVTTQNVAHGAGLAAVLYVLSCKLLKKH